MVDEWVEGALTMERAWRGLVGWWHSRGYRDVIGMLKQRRNDSGGNSESDSDEEGKRDNEEEEDDYFARELEKMGWGPGGWLEEDELMEEAELHLQSHNGQQGTLANSQGAWENGPLAMEGWLDRRE